MAGLRRLVLELGGNAATIVDEDANIDAAVNRTVMGSFSYSGQVCISVQRLFIHRKRYDEFRSKFLVATEKLVMGDPLSWTGDFLLVLVFCSFLTTWASSMLE
mgnify:CR=1 FL=1